MNANGRRVRQANNGYSHLSLRNGRRVAGGRPLYKSTTSSSVADAIERERQHAAAEARRRAKPKRERNK